MSWAYAAIRCSAAAATRRPDAPWSDVNKHRPFLARSAADEKIDEAAEAFSKVLDDWAKEYGFK